MFTIREWKIIGVFLGLFIFWIMLDKFVFATEARVEPVVQAPVDTAQQQATQIVQRVEFMKSLSGSVMANVVRRNFNLIAATSTESYAKILTRQPLVGVKENITQAVLKSPFVPVNGTGVEGVGGQLFILFPQYPDYVYRISLRENISTTTPFTITEIIRAEDTKEVIADFVNKYGQYFNDPAVAK